MLLSLPSLFPTMKHRRGTSSFSSPSLLQCLNQSLSMLRRSLGHHIHSICIVPAIGHFLLLLFIASFFNSASACSNGICQLSESCSANTDCAPGLYCGNCAAANRPQPLCTRGQANIPSSIISGLPFNKYSWLMTHNAFSNVNAPPLSGVQRITFYNQEDTVTNQLRNGVRGLMLDMYDFENDIWLCHSFQGRCYNITAFGPAVNTLREVEAFLSENPSEIVTIIIEDYVHTPKGLTRLFANAGLDKYWYPVTKMPKRGEDWPTVNEMVQQNHRLLVFTSDASKEESEGIAYQWRYMVENEPGDPGVKQGSCPNRKESKRLNSKSASLFLMNYFPTYPVEDEACKENSAPLANMVGTCYKAAGNMMPNFVAVNFYMRSDGAGVFDILDRMNGQMCGCSTVTACQPGSPSGVCKNVSAPISASTATPTFTGSFSGSVQLSGYDMAASYPNTILIFLSHLSLMVFLLCL